MGPLVPMLLLIPVLLGSAWLFRSTFVIRSCPIISTGLVILVLWIVLSYLRHYASFAKNDPDRLQSEEYRYETARLQMIAAKELPNPFPQRSFRWKPQEKNHLLRPIQMRKTPHEILSLYIQPSLHTGAST